MSTITSLSHWVSTTVYNAMGMTQCIMWVCGINLFITGCSQYTNHLLKTIFGITYTCTAENKMIT